jgi:hypothetical protein
MAALFEYPQKASFGRIIPKNKIYDHAGASASVKNLFVKQVDRIIWKYKLAPETINIPATKSVPEVQIFEISLKEQDFKFEVLQAIDKAIAFPIIFELLVDGKIKVVGAYKRPNEADSTKWVVSDYFESEWLPSKQTRNPLPVALNLAGLYEQLLLPLMPYKPREKEKLKAQVERIGLVFGKQKELSKLEIKLAKEKQFNRKVEINAQIRIIKQEIEKLTK